MDSGPAVALDTRILRNMNKSGVQEITFKNFTSSYYPHVSFIAINISISGKN